MRTDLAPRTDELTRLANRRDLEAKLARTQLGDTLVMCNLDHFKALNDSLGHAAGDVVLRDFGVVVLGALRVTTMRPGTAARSSC